MKILDQLKPTKQPIGYVFLLIVLYQLFVKGDPLPDNWLQYVVEFLGAGVSWSLVTPTAKVKDKDNASPDV